MSIVLTKPQRVALVQIASDGSMPVHQISGRMASAYRVARSLEDKGFVTRTNAGRDSADYLTITPKGREAISSPAA